MNEAIEFSKWLADQGYIVDSAYDIIDVEYVGYRQYRTVVMTLEDAYKLFEEGLNN